VTTDHTAIVSFEGAPPAAAALDRPLAQGRLSLRWNFSWMLVANVVYAGCQWAMLSVLAKLGTPEMVGQFVLALAVTTPVITLFMLQLGVVQATDARREYGFGDYLALRLTTTALALVTIAGIALASGYRREIALVIVAAGVSAAVDSISDIVYGLMQRRERMDRLAQSRIMRGALSVGALAAAVVATNRVICAILAIAASRLAILVAWDLPQAARILRSDVYDVRRDARLLPRWDVRKLIALAWTSLPLGLVMILIALGVSIPRFFVEQYLGEHALGIFGAVAFFGLAGTTAVAALGRSATPRLAQYYAQGRRRAYCVLLLKLSAFGAAVGVLGVALALLIGRQLLTILYGLEYAEHTGVLVCTMVAAGITYVASFAGYGMTAARCFRVQTLLFALVAATTAGACLWLVPAMGLMGGALALCVAAVVQLLGSVFILSLAVRARSGTRCEC